MIRRVIRDILIIFEISIIAVIVFATNNDQTYRIERLRLLEVVAVVIQTVLVIWAAVRMSLWRIV